MSYSEKLKDPRWNEKRKQVLHRDGYKCLICGKQDTELHVHHKYYLDCEPWEYDEDCFVTLCDTCHTNEHQQLAALEKHAYQCLRRKFMASEITDICAGILNIKSDHIPSLSAKMVSWFLSNREALDIGFRMFFLFNSKGKK